MGWKVDYMTHIWIFWNGKFEQGDKLNVFQAERANIVSANAAEMEKHFQPPQHVPKGCFDSLHCLHFARLNTEGPLFFWS